MAERPAILNVVGLSSRHLGPDLPRLSAAAAAGAGNDRIELTVGESCWVDIRDAGGAKVYSNKLGAGESVKLAIEYRTACDEADGVGELLKDIHQLLEWCLAHPQERLSTHWAGAGQKTRDAEERLLKTASGIPQYDSVLARFHQQVRSMPNACAVATAGSQCRPAS